MSIFTVVVLVVLLGILWAPPLVCALRLRPSPATSKVHALAFVLPVQLALAASLYFLADYIGLLNPAGYVLGISIIVGFSGAIALLFWFRSANHVLNATARKRAAR